MNVNAFGLCFLVVAVIGDETPKRMDEKTIDNMLLKIRKECIEETKPEKEVFDKALKSIMDTSNRNLQCYARCMMTKMTIMKENGDYDLNILLSQAPLSRVKIFKDVAKRCNNKTHADPCKRAMDVYVCTQKVLGDGFHFT